ncbi:uncharacterized protein FOMMEDRAFT_110956 [Fomitiporia mediterranea MF3/22]|uniref:uncharacterized protein n=1 Tax=Fomitiporia mediterranea (strain MF3/22) TaxID=694068 RepID=UPI0004408F9D|nr:uncharacterized protein FOMMEDRAFT_110956 [Fomitiporia mediterranea MF3/22]EJD01268.1 hypothetical protein FOMMEDRAFT_110956 [Fomitiporia mediterranea MF3/22]
MDDNDKQRPPSPDEKHDNSKQSHQKASVHYPDDISHSPEHVHVHETKPVRFDSSDPPSRAPSLAPSEDELDDDYDWSTEDDLVDEEEKKFEKQMGLRHERGRFVKIISFFLSTLLGSFITASVIVGVALAVHFLYFERSNDSNRDHRRFVTQNVEAWLFWAASNLLVSWFLAFLINIIPGVVTWAIFIVWGHISESMKSRVELYISVKDTIKPAFYGASGWLSWVILFQHIYHLYDADNESESRASYTPRVYQVVQFVFFLALVISIQRMLSHLIAFAFHETAFKDRLDELKFALKTIDHLKNFKPRHHRSSAKIFGGFTPRGAFGFRSGGSTPYDEKSHFMAGTSRVGTPDPYDDGHAGDTEDNSTSSKKGKGKQKHSRVKSPSATTSPGESRPDSPANALSGQLVTNAHEGHTYPPRSPESRPITPVRRNSDPSDELAVVQAGKALKKAVLSDARNITGQGEEDDLTGLGWTVGSTQEAKRIARSIFLAFKGDKKRNYLVPEDLYPAYPSSDEALAAFRVFDIDHNGDIARVEIKRVVVRTYRERRFLSRSMRDVGEALRSLNQVLLAFALIILFFISLSVFQVNIGKSLSSVYSIGIAASFIFKNTAANLFDAIMFLFVTHPYDTGDRCFIDEENLVVKKMGLFATVFTRADGTETYYFNSQLFAKFITNARRSDKSTELCTLFIDWRTSLDKLDALEKSLNDWLETEENRMYDPSTSIAIQEIEFMRYMKVTIGIPHNSNWQDWGLRNTRKTAFYAAATYYCRQLDITYYLSPMPLTWAGANEGGFAPASPASVNRDIEESSISKDEAKEMKPMLGFLPPPEKRDASLLRARKSRSGKKGAYRAMDG